MAKAGLQSIYLSGWQVAADSNMAGQTYPDQSLYPANSAAKLVERINNAFIRADQIAHMEGSDKHIDFFLPIVADCEAGFGGPLNAFELTKAMVRKCFFLSSVLMTRQCKEKYLFILFLCSRIMIKISHLLYSEHKKILSFLYLFRSAQPNFISLDNGNI